MSAEPIPSHPDLLPDPEEEHERRLTEAIERYKRENPRCACSCQRGTDGPSGSGVCVPCRRPPTQEDGLCDPCRYWKQEKLLGFRGGKTWHCHTTSFLQEQRVPDPVSEQEFRGMQERLREATGAGNYSDYWPETL